MDLTDLTSSMGYGTGLRMEQHEITDVCATLWEHITGHAVPQYKVEQERESAERYIIGYRNDIELWTIETDGCTLTAKHVRWQTFHPSADTEGVRRSLLIARGDQQVFLATEEGAGLQTKFSGPDERYQGTVHSEAQPWRIVTGTLGDAKGLCP